MFKYFKRPSKKSNDQESLSGKSENRRHSQNPSINSCDEIFYLDEIYGTNEEDATCMFECSSRLSMDLNSIINEKNCLIYFVQFLEAKCALPLIKFYLDTENFKTASESTKLQGAGDSVECCSCTISDELLNSDCISLQSQQSTGEIYKSNDGTAEAQKDVSSSKSVPGLKALYELSMQKSLTDDEKSQIYAQNNKRQLESIPSNCKHTCRATDAICIYKKYFMPSSEHYVSLPVGILSEISLIICSDGPSCQTKEIPTNLFENARAYTLEKLEHDYLCDFLQSDLYCKYCIELLTSNEMTLIDILYSESALFYFMEYLEQENQRHCLDFWMAAINFRKHYESKPIPSFKREEAQSDAMILYEKYFSLQAESPLRISDRIRSIVEEAMCGNETNSAIGRCFDRPLKIIEDYLEKEFFPRFIESQLYSKYVYEFQSKLHDHKRLDVGVISGHQQQTQKSTKHCRTMSDGTRKSTNDPKKDFISQHNTLLAMESHCNHSQKPSSGNNSPDMHIDSRQFVNPDMLWQRHQANGLKFGRVNALGRYERDFDICPATKTWSLSMGSNTIKSVVKKLANIPDDKIQEEIAWQIAEMIIDDVMSITMNRKLLKNSV